MPRGRDATCLWSTASRARTAGTLHPSWRTRWTVPSPRSATSSTNRPSAAICCRARSLTS
ncbi:hypothetical protein NIA69_07115 [Gemmiger formicilis]|nr:hypothetical protein [Gemmiger formicilis]